MLFIVEIKFINCWADETVDCTVRWNRVNRHFNITELASGNCGFNQSAFRIRPTHRWAFMFVLNYKWNIIWHGKSIGPWHFLFSGLFCFDVRDIMCIKLPTTDHTRQKGPAQTQNTLDWTINRSYICVGSCFVCLAYNWWVFAYGSCGVELLQSLVVVCMLSVGFLSLLALQYWEEKCWLHTRTKFQNTSRPEPTLTSHHLVLESVCGWKEQPDWWNHTSLTLSSPLPF